MSLTVDRQDDIDGLGGLVRQTGVASKGKREKLKKKRKAAEPVSNSKHAPRPPHESETEADEPPKPNETSGGSKGKHASRKVESIHFSLQVSQPYNQAWGVTRYVGYQSWAEVG